MSGPIERVPSSLESRVADAAALLIVGALSVMVVLDVDGPARVLLTLGFVTYVPGRAVVANWPAARARSQLVLPVVLSLSIVTLVSTVSLWLHMWNPALQFAAMGWLSVAGIALAWGPRVPHAAPRRRTTSEGVGD